MKASSGCASALRPIAAALIAIFGLSPTVSVAAPAVINCAESGPGSLRQSVLEASDPDTIDLTQLQCTISLTTGAILVGQHSLTINGPGSDKLTIDGSQNKSDYNIFLHSGSGTLEIDAMAMRHSTFYFNDDAHKYLGGGCIFSSGTVLLNDTILSDCNIVTGTGARARGGAVAAQNITVNRSVISGNSVHHGETFNTGVGGALFAQGDVTVSHSTIADNTGSSISGFMAPSLEGGGIYARGSVKVEYSTISGNDGVIGAALACLGPSLYIFASTISGNHGYTGGAIFTTNSVLSASIVNSTISGNTAVVPGMPYLSSTPAMTLRGPTIISNSTIAFNVGQGSRAAISEYFGYSLKMYGSIVADNYPADVYVDATSTLGGAYNVIVKTNAPLPASTIVSCPKLEPLANNGGPTKTHALQHTSPAIDSGLNLMGLPYEQRGVGFPRIDGVRADMGAVEWRGVADNAVFRSGFEFPAGFCELH